MENTNRSLRLTAGLAGGLLSQTVPAVPSLYGQRQLSLDQLGNAGDSALKIYSNSNRLGVKGDIQIAGDVVNKDAGLMAVGSEYSIAERRHFVCRLRSDRQRSGPRHTTFRYGTQRHSPRPQPVTVRRRT